MPHMTQQPVTTSSLLALGLSLLACGTTGDSRPSDGPSLGPLGAEGEAGTGETDGAPVADERDEFILSLGYLDISDLVPKSETDCLADCPSDGQEGEEWCSYVHYTETRHAHDLAAFQANSATLWPGNVVRGRDAQRGVLTPVGLRRAPVTFSVSLQNLGYSPVGHIEDPSLSAFRQERNRILAGGTSGKTPAKISYQIHRVFDESQVAVAVGASLDWAPGSFSSLFDFSDHTQVTKILVDFEQAYYTIDVDTPVLPSDLFADDVALEQLEDFMGDDDPPLYVQSVTYGRRVLFSLESQRTESEVRVALEASLGSVVAGGVELATEHRSVLEESRISALILGGAGGDAVKTVTGYDGLLEFIQAGGDYSDSSPGAEIAYKLAYLDNSGVKLALTTDYAERQCYDNLMNVGGQLVQLEYLGGNDDGPASVELYGDVVFRVAGPADPDPCGPDAPGWRTIFHRGQLGPQLVNRTWVPQNPPLEQVFEFPVDPGNQLCLWGHLAERDQCLFCPDDDLGPASVGPIPLSAGWAGDHVLEFNGDGTVAATVRITVD